MKSSSAKLFSLLVSFCLLFLVAANVHAQSGTTSLRGTITDKTGASVGDAKVALNNPAQAFHREAQTSTTGEYEFVALPPGTYVLSVEKAGFRKFEQRNLQLLVNLPATVNATLDVGAANEIIEVSAQTVALNTTDASIGNAISGNQLAQLPLEGDNVPDLLTLQAGVAYTGNRPDINRDIDTRSGAVNGARSDQSNVTLDGVDVNDQVNGSAFTSVLPVTVDSLQEFRVTTTNANADQGRSSGAQVSLVTKSGTNSFHGSAYESHRNTYTSANDYFVKQAELQSGQPNVPPKLIRNIYGGSLGGPILKDRFFFFVNYEAARQREEASVLRIVPSDNLRLGKIQYVCSPLGVTPTDPNCSTSNPKVNVVSNPALGLVATLTPAQILAMDPLSTNAPPGYTGPVGVNPVMLTYFNTFPEPNDFSQGDLLNFVGYRFRGPVPTNNKWYIARADYKITSSGSHTLFWRGALRNDAHSTAPYLPGRAPLQTLADFSKGYTVGYVAVLKPTIINSFHWGFTRQSSGLIGNNDSQPFNYFRGLNDNEGSNNSELAVTRSRAFQTPVYNIVDDVSWTRGKHTFQFGTNIRFIRDPRQNFLSSFSSASTNSSGLDTAGIVGNPKAALSPGNHSSDGLPAVDPSYRLGYNWPIMAMMGILSEVDATFNFDKTGTALPQGASLSRRFGADEYEFYLQDSYRMKSNLTFNFGLRYSLFSPPWETNGTEVTPQGFPIGGGSPIPLSQWFSDRATKMLNGGSSVTDPLLTYSLAGPANGKAGLYNWDYHNLGPHVAFAYSPRASGGLLHSLFGDGDKTVIRGGFGVVFDRIGAGLLSSFDANGSFGLSTAISAPVPCVGPSSIDPCTGTPIAPRLTDLNVIPQLDASGNQFFPATPSGGFPFTYPPAGTGLAIQWGLDPGIKTPYAYTIDFSVGRELPGGMSLEVSYVGRIAHRLLSQQDLAMPLNITDPKSKINYFTAAKKLSQLGFAGTPTSAVTSSTVGPTGAYWQNIVAPLKPGDAYSLACSGGFTTDATQAMYDLFSCGGGPVGGPGQSFGDETTPLAQLDYWGSDFSGTAGILGQSGTYYPSIYGPNAFFNSQFHSLYAWRSVGNANYHALQAVLRKRLSHGVQFDVNYTFSKSIDISSDAERIGAITGGLGGQIINSWSPNAERAVSDFDTAHQINTNWIAELPFGKGRWLGRNAHGFAEAIIGGWQLSGLARWTSGFPVSMTNGGTWPTNWELGGPATQFGQAHPHTTTRPDGSVNLFPKDLPQLPLGLGIGPFRHDLPGESGTRNTVRGPGFAGLDLGLSKQWKMPWKESHSLQLRWEVFNVPNLKRFDIQTITTDISSSSFGVYSGLLTNPRVMQFSLRYAF